jgi:hypothetical protein
MREERERGKNFDVCIFVGFFHTHLLYTEITSPLMVVAKKAVSFDYSAHSLVLSHHLSQLS